MDAAITEEITSFEQLDLSPVMLSALRRLGYSEPTSIQAQVIPPALESLDIVGQARTGTGKTAAFGIPILELLDPLTETRNPQALILVPTRELADQVHQEIVKLAYGCPTATAVLAGGKHMRRQIDQLAHGVQLVVGTPGRVLDHIGRGTMKLHDIWCVVLDEADRMLDIGFRPAIERILRACPTDRQTMLLSATMPPVIEKLSERYLQNPVRINCSQSQVSSQTIEQRYFTVKQDDKYRLLLGLLKREQPRQVIIFCRTKRGTDRLHRALQMEARHMPELARMRMACIHGDMNQRDRDRVFTSLRAGELNLLVATDVVGRGIDVSTVSHIINYDIPLDCDDYVHRVGRTGRMGREGIAFTFVTASEGQQLTAIELNINRLLVRDSLTDAGLKLKSGAAAPASETSALEPAAAERAGAELAGREQADREPAGRDPAGREPVATHAVSSEAARGESAQAEPESGWGVRKSVGQEPARKQPARSEPARSEPARSEPARSEPARSEPARSEPARREPARREAWASGVAEAPEFAEPPAFASGLFESPADVTPPPAAEGEPSSAELSFGTSGQPRRRKLFPMKRRTNERLAKLSDNKE